MYHVGISVIVVIRLDLGSPDTDECMYMCVCVCELTDVCADNMYGCVLNRMMGRFPGDVRRQGFFSDADFTGRLASAAVQCRLLSGRSTASLTLVSVSIYLAAVCALRGYYARLCNLPDRSTVPAAARRKRPVTGETTVRAAPRSRRSFFRFPIHHQYSIGTCQLNAVF